MAAVYEGEFDNGHLQGEGTFTWPDGSSYKGNGKMICRTVRAFYWPMAVNARETGNNGRSTAEEKARLKAEAEARIKAEAEARKTAEEEARLKAEAEAKKNARRGTDQAKRKPGRRPRSKHDSRPKQKQEEGRGGSTTQG